MGGKKQSDLYWSPCLFESKCYKLSNVSYYMVRSRENETEEEREKVSGMGRRGKREEKRNGRKRKQCHLHTRAVHKVSSLII